jgi:hypothetical protein
MARQQKEFRWIAVAMKIAIATAIQAMAKFVP